LIKISVIINIVIGFLILYTLFIISIYKEIFDTNLKIQDLLNIKVNLLFGDKKYSCVGFIDTGNNLCDPLTQKPVFIIDLDVIKNILPINCFESLNKSISENNVDELLNIPEISKYIRLVPFSSLGKANGLLISIKIDKITLKLNKVLYKFENPVLGISNQKLDGRNKYQMIIPFKLFV